MNIIWVGLFLDLFNIQFLSCVLACWLKITFPTYWEVIGGIAQWLFGTKTENLNLVAATFYC